MDTLERQVLTSSTAFLNDDSQIKKLLSELTSVRDIVRETHKNNFNEFYLKNAEPALVLDYIIYLHLRFFLLLSENFVAKENKNIEITVSADVSQKMSYTTLVVTQLVNSLISIRLLLERGLDVQAKQVFRSYIEYSDIALAILGSDDFYYNYKKMGEDPGSDKKIWYKHVRPSALTKTLKRIFSDYADKNKDIWNTVQNIRAPIYQHLSDYAHGHCMAIFISAFTEDEGSTLLGSVNRQSHETIVNTIIYGYSFLKHSMVMIVQHQGIPFIKFGDDGLSYVKHFKMLELYFPDFVERNNYNDS